MVAESDEFAADAAVVPRWVVGRHLDCKLAQRRGGGWPSWWSVWLGPVFGDAAAMPSQEGVGSYKSACARGTGEGLSDGAE